MKSQVSLRTRLLLAVGAIALVALVISDLLVYTSLKSYLYGQADATLQLTHISVEQAALVYTSQGGTSSPSSGQNGSSTFCAIGREIAPGMFIEVGGSTGGVVSGTVCRAFAPGYKIYSPSLPRSLSGLAVTPSDPREAVIYFTAGSTAPSGPTFRVRASTMPNGDVLVVADPIGSISNTLSHLVLLELLVTVAALLGAILLGIWLVRVGLRPLRDVVKTAYSISGGDLLERVPNANTKTEVGHVATALNVMLERIQGSFQDLRESEARLRQFVADASHELRTPIAAVSAYAQLFEQGAADHDEDLPRVMKGIEREAGRMARLVEDLLFLARFDEEHPVDAEPVELVGLAAEAIETARTLGAAWPIAFVAEEPVEVMGDRLALRQVLDNLLANVREHTPPGTLATVRVERVGNNALLEVADNGPGIPDEQLADVFDRFMRGDPSRSRQTGGAGLGLAIVAAISRAHHGQATAAARPGGGSVFSVSLPALDSSSSDAQDREAPRPPTAPVSPGSEGN